MTALDDPRRAAAPLSAARFVSPLGPHLVAYLQLMRAVGRRYERVEAILRNLDRFAAHEPAGEVLLTRELLGRWLASTPRLAIQGRSNGGLLVGAVMNQRPELFRVAIPEVGVMDMLRFQKFTIGWNWIADYGSSDDPEEFKALYAYSPLHNVKAGVTYPATLVTTADHDDRVVPAHSFKYAATLQALASHENPILIRIETRSGHGASSLTKQLEATADVYTFIMHNMGVTPNFTHGASAADAR